MTVASLAQSMGATIDVVEPPEDVKRILRGEFGGKCFVVYWYHVFVAVVFYYVYYLVYLLWI
jgi:hypothetical protein